MATKEDDLFLKLLQPSSTNHSYWGNNQFSNFNLNQSHKCLNDNFQLNSKTNNNKIYETFTLLDYYTVTEKYNENKWNKSTKISSLKSSRNLNVDNKAKQKRWMNVCSSDKNSSSTLSLHISAYETSIEADKNDEIQDLSKKFKAFKSVFSNFQDTFEFPRQQEGNGQATPEIQKFAASQKLFPPNQGALPSASQMPPPPILNEQKLPIVNEPKAIVLAKPDQPNLSKPVEQKEEENLKTAIELDEKLSAFNILEISALILVTILHSIGILIIAFFFSIYQIFVSIFHVIKYCREHPWKTRYGFQALKYAYSKEWWTFKGLYRWLTEPPPPPIFAQRTLSGELKIDPIEAAKWEALQKQKMFHQKRFNGTYTLKGFVPPQPQNLELLKKKE